VPPALRLPTRDLLLVAVGGAVGASARWGLLESTVGSDGGRAGPILLANLVGCGLLGLLVGAARTRGVGRTTRLLVGAGFCGGLTTFSTFAVEVAAALRDADPSGAVGYTVLSVAGGLAAFLLGRSIGQRSGRDSIRDATC